MLEKLEAVYEPSQLGCLGVFSLPPVKVIPLKLLEAQRSKMYKLAGTQRCINSYCWGAPHFTCWAVQALVEGAGKCRWEDNTTDLKGKQRHKNFAVTYSRLCHEPVAERAFASCSSGSQPSAVTVRQWLLDRVVRLNLPLSSPPNR